MKRPFLLLSLLGALAVLPFAAQGASAAPGAPASPASPAAPASQGSPVNAPLTCSQGPSNQRFTALLTLPRDVAPGATYTVRIDGVSSGTISHFGLNDIRDMETDYVLPPEATYVAGSARVIPETGTANVASTARVTNAGRAIRVALPGRVAAGTSYTPPSIEFRLVAPSAAGAALAIALSEYRVTANAVVVGDVHTRCEPSPKPFTLGVTHVTNAPNVAPVQATR